MGTTPTASSAFLAERGQRYDGQKEKQQAGNFPKASHGATSVPTVIIIKAPELSLFVWI
jgi:hypothetical protein